MSIERRTICRPVELREADDNGPALRGYAAVFGQESDDLGGFVEVIEPGAFDGVLDDDVRALWNHNDDYVLGRTASGTLQLAVDDTGLRYEVTPPDTQWARDALVSVRRGDVTQSSFAFQVAEDRWERVNDDVPLRRIARFAALYDVSPVTYPAYSQTSAEARAMALEVAQGREGPEDGDGQGDVSLTMAKRRLALAEIEI